MSAERFAYLLMAAVVAMSTSHEKASAADSIYTSTYGNHCTQISEYELGATFRCEAAGQIYDIAEGDLRFSLSFGVRKGDQPPARWLSFGGFNNIGEKMEWRRDDEGRVIAAILRHFVDNSSDPDARKEQVLVVFKVAPGAGACHVAYVDALANKDANLLAREAADRLTPHFDCQTDRGLWYGAVSATAPERPLAYE